MKRIVVGMVLGGTAGAVLSLLALFQAAVKRCNSAAAESLLTGLHAVWRQVEGSLFRDPDFAGAQP
ncbi:MAG: hypothetical protein Q7J47_11940 [Azoarcus sp.]|nr:hypothetical protein [Azoarcus sp.]